MTAIEVMKISVTEKPCRVIQITDCHLGEHPGEQLVGMDTDESLDHVLQLVKQQEPDAQLILATGDLANHGAPSAYERLLDKLKLIDAPSAWLAGNHDVRDAMVKVAGDAYLPRMIELGSWAILMLNSAVPNQVGGELGGDELAALTTLLKSCTDAKHIAICLHHPPVSIGCDWLDTQQLADSTKMFALLAADPRLRAIIWGHVHQEFNARDARLPAVDLLAAPSTCIQFAPNSREFKLDNQAPGYRWFDFYQDGRLQTGISRLQGIDLSYDQSSTGY